MSSIVDTLRARIAELEADNASLSAAAAEAASLAEEYAHDAAQYRQGKTADTALVTELTDATRRKDRRIARLSSLLQTEKEDGERLRKQVSELEECLKVADEIIEVMRKTVGELKEKGARANPGGMVDCVRVIEDDVNKRIWGVLREYLPDWVDVEGDFAAIKVLRSGMSCRRIVREIGDKLGSFRFEKLQQEFRGILQEVEDGIANVIRWIFVEGKLKQRAERVAEVVGGLESCMFAFFNDVDFGWSEGFVSMRKEVITIALERVVDAADGGIDGDEPLNWAIECLEKRAKRVCGELRRDDVKVVNLQLENKTKEIEDTLVKVALYEERVKKGVKDEEEVKNLQNRVKQKDEEIDMLKEQIREVVMAAQERKEEKEEVDVDEVREVQRLRRSLVRRQLADIWEEKDCEQLSVAWREKWKQHETVRSKWTEAKIVELDASLQPLHSV